MSVELQSSMLDRQRIDMMLVQRGRQALLDGGQEKQGSHYHQQKPDKKYHSFTTGEAPFVHRGPGTPLATITGT